MIRFVSNLPPDLRSGGFSAMNAQAYAALAGRFETRYAGPIDPPVVLIEKAVSKARRLAGLAGDFFAYSRRRLEAFAAGVAAMDQEGASLDFFHGFTPWILTEPQKPYVAWSDCSFHDYIEVFHGRPSFSAADLDRIERLEERWLRRASRVLFTSAWAAERAVAQYGLDPLKVRSVGIFGEFGSDGADDYAGAPNFAFVSTDFVRKGGPVALEAFRILRQTHPDARLAIVGDHPRARAPDAGVSYLGYLRKESSEELEAFRRLLATSAALVHPTCSDVAPLIVVEAAMFGCPAISTRAFAIPEIVEDGLSGTLLDPPPEPGRLAAAMRWMLDHPSEHLGMRRAAQRRAIRLHGKAAFEARLLEVVSEVLLQAGAEAA
jgi:glycosyltransferase involved in cell wall biosynthesis